MNPGDQENYKLSEKPLMTVVEVKLRIMLPCVKGGILDFQELSKIKCWMADNTQFGERLVRKLAE